jgi:hypothetical protein
MELPIYELKIVEDLLDAAEVSFVALVDKPAIMKDFHVFSEKQRQSFAITNEEQHIISGLLMLANTPIYRDNKKFGEHYVTFSPETIKDIAIKFSKKGYQKNVNLMHDSNMQVEGLVMFESFIVDKARGILPMAGHEDAKDGSWFGSFFVENEEVWQLIKEGKVKGFSVEGYFDYAAPNKEESYAEKKLKELSALLKVPF